MSKITPELVRSWKGRQPRFLALTAWDYPLARLLDHAGVEILHVGDTLGIIALGYAGTASVSMSDMLHHTAAVARAQPGALVTADLPFGAYHTADDAVAHAESLVRAGAEAVKMEGGREIYAQIEAVLEHGIAVQGHLGLLPQTDKSLKKKGRDPAGLQRLLDDARLLEQLGCFSIVLENCAPEAAGEVTRAVSIPTIGIASGNVCDGEIRVLSDVLHLCPWNQARFVEPAIDLAAGITQAVRALAKEVGGSRAPR